MIYDGNDSNITQVYYARRISMSTSISKGYGSSPVLMHPVYGLPKYQPAPDFIPWSSSKKFLKLPNPNGELYSQAEAYDLLMQPIWGENGNKTFVDSLPVLKKQIHSQYIWVSNYTPISILPTEPGNYILRKLFDADRGSYMYSNALPLESSQWWYLMGFEEWKREGDANAHQELNPDWEDVTNENNQIKLDVEALFKDTFKLYAEYLFPGLPINTTIIPSLIADTNLQIAYWNKSHPLIPDPNWVPDRTKVGSISNTVPLVTSWTEADRWTPDTIPTEFLFKWEIVQDGIRKQIPVMDDYWLAVPSTTGSKKIPREIPNNFNLSFWDTFVNIILVSYSSDRVSASTRTKKLLGL